MPRPLRPPSKKFSVLLRLLPFLRPHWGKVTGFLTAMLIAAGATLLLPRGVGWLVDNALKSPQELHRAALLILGIGVLMSLASAVRYALITWTGQRVIADLRRSVFGRVLEQSPAFFETQRTGEVITRLSSDVTLLEAAVSSTLSVALRSSVTLIGALVMMAVTSARLTGIALLVVPVIVFSARTVGRVVRRLSRAVQDRLADLGALVEESLNGIRTVQAYNQQESISTRYDGVVDASLATTAQRIAARSAAMAVVGLTVFGALALVIWVGGGAVLRGELSTGALTAFLMYAFFATLAVASLGEVWGSLQQASGAGERLFELLDEQSAVREPAAPLPVPPGQGALRFEQVSFRYPLRPERPALNALSLEIPAGARYALVGPSGAGKSTIFQLLLRFYDPESGQILIDGAPIQRLRLQDLRTLFALVPQEPIIFTGNAWDNIRIGRPDADVAEVRQAAADAQALGFLEALPQGLDTPLGEKGITLSGGQKQRLAIARALLRQPRVLLLDEATSALDAENERAIQLALETVSRHRTTLVIAHRLATVRHADRIVVLDQGRIRAVGRHEELIRKDDLYARLAALQFGEMREDVDSPAQS